MVGIVCVLDIIMIIEIVVGYIVVITPIAVWDSSIRMVAEIAMGGVAVVVPVHVGGCFWYVAMVAEVLMGHIIMVAPVVVRCGDVVMVTKILMGHIIMVAEVCVLGVSMIAPVLVGLVGVVREIRVGDVVVLMVYVGYVGSLFGLLPYVDRQNRAGVAQLTPPPRSRTARCRRFPLRSRASASPYASPGRGR